jgi:EmrB/QacA subfamily drug resistance transporter
MAMAVFVVANDVTALSVALTDIEQDFDSDVSTVQWVINAYALIFGVLIVTGGRLADMFGRKRMFFVGAGIFAAFSLLAGIAQDELWLILARALMGIGGALMWPAVLGMTYDILPEEKAGLAGGLIIGAAGFGNAAGPLLGGALTELLSWRWVMFVNVPIAAFACFVTWKAVKESAGGERGRIDYAGIATISVGLIALLVALDQVTDWGWTDPRVLVLAGACALLLIAFVVIERRIGKDALVPPDVMRNRSFRAACLATLFMSAVFFSALLYLPQFMQKLLDYSPLESGLGLLPLMGTFAITSFAAGPLYNRLGAKVIVSAGALCLTVGAFLVSTIEPGADWVSLLPGMIVLGLGVGLFYSSITTAAVTALDPSRSSLAGGIVYMFQVAGGSIGLGLTTTVFTTASEDHLQEQAADLAESQREALMGTLAGTESAAELIARFSERTGERLVDLVHDAFTSGMEWSFRLVAALALVGMAISVLFVGGSLLRRQAGPAVQPESSGPN